MRRLLPTAICALLLALAATGAWAAQAVLLVPGYLGGVESWDRGGVSQALRGAGWRDGGVFHPRARLPEGAARPMFFRVALPTEAPVPAQGRLLGDLAERLHGALPDAGLVAVGHSAGGVVARYAMVRRPELPWRGLVTIASPHLGTRAAEVGAMAGATPLAWAAPFMGADALNRSQWLYRDLVPARPGTFLHWLNRQPHPEAAYVGVVRSEGGLLDAGDLVVPPRSQDLRQVSALGPSARRVVQGEEHGLGPADGRLLARLLAGLRESAETPGASGSPTE